MKGGHNKKSVRVEFVMSEPEAELVKERMAELGITNPSGQPLGWHGQTDPGICKSFIILN